MKIGEYDVLVTSSVDEDELSAEIRKWKTKTKAYELGVIKIKDGKPTIYINPNIENEKGVWSIEYNTFRKIVKALDDFLVSIGYQFDTEEGKGV